MRITEKQRQQIKSILCEMALEATLLQNKMGAVNDMSRKIMQEAEAKARRIASFVEEDCQDENNARNGSDEPLKKPENPNESQMERDDANFKKGYKACEKEWAENFSKEYEHGYAKGFNDGQKNVKNIVEVQFNEGFEKGLASLESESKFRMEVRKRLKQLEDLLVI